MKHLRSEQPLREVLRIAIDQRRAALRNGRSHRKDHDRMNAALSRAEQFLISYPVANDLRVRGWCLANHADVAIIVPGNTPTALARLVMQALKPQDKTEAA